ncbi:MAG: hypothetical protein WKF84_03865 [Pyrinomonadaceae bacterium]
MNETRPTTVLCLASYEKGAEFMRECKRQGARVLLLTSQSIADADWPRESLDEVFLIPDENKKWRLNDVIKGVSYLARRELIDRIVALDDFDLEMAAALREHLRLPGLGDSTTRYFRDKLAMRMRAVEAEALVPDFVHVLNYDAVRSFTERVPPPWLLKPRFEASASGIVKIKSAVELWPEIEKLGDKQSFYLIEAFVPGHIYHVDSIVVDREVRFATASLYGSPPLDVAQHGGIFTSSLVPYESTDEQALLAMNREILRACGLRRGVSHTEFIKAHEDGRFYFLETSARVGGAYIVELVEAASGVNLWAEWAKIEITTGENSYQLPVPRRDYAGLLVSLARQECPETSTFNDPEIVWRLKKRNHVGFIIASPDCERVSVLLKDYMLRVQRDFFATQPQTQRPCS